MSEPRRGEVDELYQATIVEHDRAADDARSLTRIAWKKIQAIDLRS